MKLENDHVSIKFAKEMDKICKGFFTVTKLNIFSYVRVYKNGQILSLTTNGDFQKSYYAEEFYKRPNAVNTCVNAGEHLLFTRPELKDMIEHAQSFGISNFFEKVCHRGRFYEVLRFGSDIDNNNAINLYLNNRNAITQFYYFFLEQARNLIKAAEDKSNLIDLSEYFKQEEVDVNYSLNIIENIKTNKFYICNNEHQYLTSREMQCLLLMMQGESGANIARLLHISESTVKSYVQNMLHKFNVTSKSELIQRAITLEFMNLIK